MGYTLGAVAGIAAITGVAYAVAAWLGTRMWPGNPGRIVGAAFASVGGGTLALIGNADHGMRPSVLFLAALYVLGPWAWFGLMTANRRLRERGNVPPPGGV